MKKLIMLATSLAMLPATAVLAVAQTETGSEVQGPITSISGSTVLVEENPADESGSAKGAFTVTGETEVFRRSGDLQVPASFDDLRVGQPVIASFFACSRKGATRTATVCRISQPESPCPTRVPAQCNTTTPPESDSGIGAAGSRKARTFWEKLLL